MSNALYKAGDIVRIKASGLLAKVASVWEGRLPGRAPTVSYTLGDAFGRPERGTYGESELELVEASPAADEGKVQCRDDVVRKGLAESLDVLAACLPSACREVARIASGGSLSEEKDRLRLEAARTLVQLFRELSADALAAKRRQEQEEFFERLAERTRKAVENAQAHKAAAEPDTD